MTETKPFVGYFQFINIQPTLILEGLNEDVSLYLYLQNDTLPDKHLEHFSQMLCTFLFKLDRN